MRAAALVLALALPTAPALAAGVAAPAPAAPTAELAEALLPEPVVADLAAALLARQRAEAVAADPALRARYARSPGLQRFVAERLRGDIAPVLRRALPELRAEIRAILDAEMSPQEVRDSLAFLRTPAGQRLHATLADALRAGEAQIDPSRIFDLLVRSTPVFDYPTVLAFLSSSAGQKIAIVQPKVAAAGQSWSETLLRKNDAKLQRALAKAERDFAKERGR